MIAGSSQKRSDIATFRTKLSAAMMLVVAAITAFGFYLAQRNVARNAERALRQNFQTELFALDKLLELRHAAVTERCQKLAADPRIHAALEDNALDLLYPSAKDELRDLMKDEEASGDQVASTLRAKFYRFLDNHGAVLPPPDRKSTRLNSSHLVISYAVFCLKKKKKNLSRDADGIQQHNHKDAA